MTKASDTDPVRSLRVGRGEPLVLIHPFTTNARIWRGVAEELSDRFDVLMLTLPGHFGGDKVPFGDITIPKLADFVEAEMDAVGWSTAHVAGNSLGGWLSLELAARGRARSVTAFAPAGGWGNHFDLRRTVPLGVKFLGIAPLALLGRYAYPIFKDLPLAHQVMLSIVAGDWRKVELRDSQAMMRASTHCAGYLAVLLNGFRHGGMAEMEDVAAPVRLVLCGKDVIIPPGTYGSLYDERLPNVDTVLVESIGHVPMLEAPELCADLIAEHALAYQFPVAI
ncbi:MAG TPA: alpha/beta hydrolase [Nocardioidaceae bacterium]|nr:alpha/beta hydrolase [Nocardioidaceae bacterium]